MIPCHAVKIQTPNGIVLDGLWFGPAKAARAVVHVHGLGSSAFSAGPALALAGKGEAVLTFSNRGHDRISKIRRADGRRPKAYGGSAHEVFADCADDIAGAVAFAVSRGAKNVTLSGHSTGCQKIVWYASHGAHRTVKRLVLLAPLSDHAGTPERVGLPRWRAAVTAAKRLVRQGRPHQLLPEGVWHDVIDAQRLLSLYTPDSKEEVFCYAQPGKTPTALRRVKLPMLALLGGADPYADRPAVEIAEWFRDNFRGRRDAVRVINGADHGFSGLETEVARAVADWRRNR